MKKTSYYIFSLIIIFLLNGCQDVKKGFSGKKLDQGNEFLVIKKNPLVVPPNFNELPKPKNSSVAEDSASIDDNSNNNFKKLLDKNDQNQKESSENTANSTLEEKVLNKIK